MPLAFQTRLIALAKIPILAESEESVPKAKFGTAHLRTSAYQTTPSAVYPDLDRLAGLSAKRARRLYGLVYPRDTRIVRLVFFAMSLILRLLRKPVRGFVHPVDAIERVVRENGLSPDFSRGVGRVWQVNHREPVHSARPVAVFRVTAAARW